MCCPWFGTWTVSFGNEHLVPRCRFQTQISVGSGPGPRPIKIKLELRAAQSVGQTRRDANARRRGRLLISARIEQTCRRPGHERAGLPPGQLCLPRGHRTKAKGMDEERPWGARGRRPFLPPTKGVGKGTGLGLSMVHGNEGEQMGGPVGF